MNLREKTTLVFILLAMMISSLTLMTKTNDLEKRIVRMEESCN